MSSGIAIPWLKHPCQEKPTVDVQEDMMATGHRGAAQLVFAPLVVVASSSSSSSSGSSGSGGGSGCGST